MRIRGSKMCMREKIRKYLYLQYSVQRAHTDADANTLHTHTQRERERLTVVCYVGGRN